ncbi:MAG TPA: Gfo/Idh/MocA family oxidoreductase [Gemmataceae bacterium]|jgi:predicted dehydrogenase
MPRANVNRRHFLKTSVIGASALSLTAASARRVYGANERIGLAFLGVGGRCQIHLDLINQLKKEEQGVEPIAVCDVWDGNKKLNKSGGRGLYPSAEKCGLKVEDKVHVTKDYRRLLDLKEVDAVCIATPDHWHAKMTLDAAEAGKDIYCEKPITRTIAEAQAVVDAVHKHNRVMTVGVQSMADPRWHRAYELIRDGKIGHVAQAQTSYYRNGITGQARFHPLSRDMTPKTIDWDMFLGHAFHVFPGEPLAPKMPFDRAVYAQWRCYWAFGSGFLTDLLVHQMTHLITAMGVRYPARVVGSGGIYLEYDERDVPDVGTIVAEYDAGCQAIATATMIAAYPIEEVIRGRLGVIKFLKDGFEIIRENPKGGAGLPARLEETVHGQYEDCHPPKGRHQDTKELWMDFLKKVREHNRATLSPPELGAAAFTTIAMGVLSYRKGQVLFWDKERRKAILADGSWAERWEQRSKKRGKPNQVLGWRAGDTGSVMEPPAHMKLAGPWIDGKDPAGE